MKALTIWQPWASLIAIGAKPYEFRGWRAPDFLIGQRIAIHAGARPMRKAEIAALILNLRDDDECWMTCLKRAIALPLLERAHMDASCLPLSAIVATAVVGKAVLGTSIAHEFGGPPADSDRSEHSNFAWPLRDIQALVPAVDVKGAQGFWNFNESLLCDAGGVA